jgi:hypothetical protein
MQLGTRGRERVDAGVGKSVSVFFFLKEPLECCTEYGVTVLEGSVC